MQPSSYLFCFASHPSESYNLSPTGFPATQRYLSMEMSDGGSALVAFDFRRVDEAVSIFHQVACAVAVAEEALEFEHRDLHDGNVLVKRLPLDAVSISFCSCSHSFHV
jgi:hypothetical protein